MCTLSGYWKAKFAEHGTITASNEIDTSAAGYQSLASVNSVYSIATTNFATMGRSGFYQDLGTTSLINPIGASGLSYCQCVAIMVNGYESRQSELLAANLPSGPGNASANMYFTAGVDGFTMDAGNLGTTLTVATLNDLSDEYNSLSTHIQEAIGNDRSTNTSTNPLGTTSTFSKQGDIDAVNAILGSLGKLDKCASMAFDVIL